MIELPPGPSAIDLAAAPNLPLSGTLGTLTGATLHQAVFDYTSSIRFDWKLYRQDVRGSIGHVRMLASALPEIMPPADAAEIEQALRDICVEMDTAGPAFEPLGEDVHSHVELRLRQVLEFRHAGRGEEMGRRLHTARSRNDQVATDVRLWCLEAADELSEAALSLQDALLDRARAYASAPFPGYTHLQPAQPVLFAHHLLAYVEMIERDLIRLDHARDAADVLPLGSAALAGTTFAIRRDEVATSLGFSRLSANSMDAVSDRDFAVELLSACALLMAHLSRFSEDLVLWASDEFGLIDLDASWAEGSSIMPQKRNPDTAELTRGKAGRVFGHLLGMLTVIKGVPMTYGRELQEDKEALFDAAVTVRGALRALTVATSSLTLREERAAQRAKAGYSTATDLADHLVRRGVAFRSAYEAVKRIVQDAHASGLTLEELSLDTLRGYHPSFGESALEDVSVERSLAARDVAGGTAPRQVENALTDAATRVASRRDSLRRR